MEPPIPMEMPRYFCRTHGEPLVPDMLRHGWSCPEVKVCGTWVGKEWEYRRATPEMLNLNKIVVGQKTWDQMMAALERPPKPNEKMRAMVLRARAREGTGR